MFLDVWPVNSPMIAIMDPAICQYFTVEHTTEKADSLPHFLYALAGKDDMVSANGNVWKKWRTMFNPGKFLLSLSLSLSRNFHVNITNISFFF